MAATVATGPTSTSPWTQSASKSERIVTVLLTTFAGLGLPRTLSLPVSASTTIHNLLRIISDRLPEVHHTLVITTTSNKQLLFSNNEPISTLLSSQADTFLPLRLSARLCGGKGGFGSQLRAAGGRMSSRKNRQNQNTNGSNRNLDGRRLNVVAAAKLLAEGLAKRDEEERKTREERKKQLEDKIDAADRQMENIKSGKLGVGQGRLDAEYVESKEVAEEKTREAIMNNMKASATEPETAQVGTSELERTGSESSMEMHKIASDDDEAEERSSASSEDVAPVKAQSNGPAFFGWGDDDDEYSDEDEEDAEPQSSYEGKGKAKAG